MVSNSIRKPMFLKAAMVGTIVLTLVLLGLLLRPEPLFAHKFRHGQFVVHSDRPIEQGWEAVLADAERRISTSELYDGSETFRIFVCHQSWRLLLLTRSTEVGGFADTVVTRNIYLRGTAAAENRIVPPGETFADAESRPLSYFIAHEAAHVMQAKRFGRTVSVMSPRWLVEGYADYVAKAGEFDFADNRRRLLEGDALLSESYALRGLYRRYHLLVDQALRDAGGSAHRLFADPPSEAEILARLYPAPPVQRP